MADPYPVRLFPTGPGTNCIVTHSDERSMDPTGSVADRSQIEVEHHLREEGFTGQFGAREGRRVLCCSPAP